MTRNQLRSLKSEITITSWRKNAIATERRMTEVTEPTNKDHY